MTSDKWQGGGNWHQDQTEMTPGLSPYSDPSPPHLSWEVFPNIQDRVMALRTEDW